jgi:hypothetical protein
MQLAIAPSSTPETESEVERPWKPGLLGTSEIGKPAQSGSNPKPVTAVESETRARAPLGVRAIKSSGD